jgi:hypothetical protein
MSLCASRIKVTSRCFIFDKAWAAIQQDFYAKIVASNLTALMEIAAQKKVDKRTHDLVLNY